MRTYLILALSLVTLSAAASAQPERQTVGQIPKGWQYDENRRFVALRSSHMEPDQYFEVQSDGDNKFLRSYTRKEAHRIFRENGTGYNWDVREYPILRWRWRAVTLPAGAREDRPDLNDTGGALYVTFSRDWLGRPQSIKYTYSSSLPVGTVISDGSLKIVVVSSGSDGIGKWKTVERNVVEDYRELFGGDPAAKPVVLFVWNDSDSTGDESTVDFDDITLISQ